MGTASSNYLKLGALLVHSCNKVLRGLLPVIIRRNRPLEVSTLDELIQKDSQKLAREKIVRDNRHLVFTWNGMTRIESWDPQLLCFFIKKCCPQNDPVCADIDTLKDIRNKLCHTADGLIDDAYYQRKRDEIRDINTRFLTIINDAGLTAAMMRESDEIDQGRRNVEEAIDTLNDWRSRDEELRTPVDQFSNEHQPILSALLAIQHQSDQYRVPDAEFDIRVEGADNIQQANQVSDILVNILDPKLRNDPHLHNLTEHQFSVIKTLAREGMGGLLESGQVVVRTSHGSCTVTVRSTSFDSLLRLWTKIVSGEADIVFKPLTKFLNSFVSEKLTLNVVLPECSFLEVIDNLVTQMQAIQGRLALTKEYETVEQIHGMAEGVKQLAVNEQLPTPVLKIKIKPYSRTDLENIVEQFSDGSIERSFERLTATLQRELSAPGLKVTARLRSPSVKPESSHLDFSATHVNPTFNASLQRLSLENERLLSGIGRDFTHHGNTLLDSAAKVTKATDQSEVNVTVLTSCLESANTNFTTRTDDIRKHKIKINAAIALCEEELKRKEEILVRNELSLDKIAEEISKLKLKIDQYDTDAQEMEEEARRLKKKSSELQPKREDHNRKAVALTVLEGAATILTGAAFAWTAAGAAATGAGYHVASSWVLSEKIDKLEKEATHNRNLAEESMRKQRKCERDQMTQENAIVDLQKSIGELMTAIEYLTEVDVRLCTSIDGNDRFLADVQEFCHALDEAKHKTNTIKLIQDLIAKKPILAKKMDVSKGMGELKENWGNV